MWKAKNRHSINIYDRIHENHLESSFSTEVVGGGKNGNADGELTVRISLEGNLGWE